MNSLFPDIYSNAIEESKEASMRNSGSPITHSRLGPRSAVMSSVMYCARFTVTIPRTRRLTN